MEKRQSNISAQQESEQFFFILATLLSYNLLLWVAVFLFQIV